jgi:hypothetical protein
VLHEVSPPDVLCGPGRSARLTLFLYNVYGIFSTGKTGLCGAAGGRQRVRAEAFERFARARHSAFQRRMVHNMTFRAIISG